MKTIVFYYILVGLFGTYSSYICKTKKVLPFYLFYVLVLFSGLFFLYYFSGTPRPVWMFGLTNKYHVLHTIEHDGKLVSMVKTSEGKPMLIEYYLSPTEKEKLEEAKKVKTKRADLDIILEAKKPFVFYFFDFDFRINESWPEQPPQKD